MKLKEKMALNSFYDDLKTSSQTSPVKKFRGAILSADGFVLDEN